MNRRNFLSLAALALAGKAAERVFPFRVYSIPKEIVITPHPLDTMFQIEASAQQRFMASLDGQKLKLYGGARGGQGKHARMVAQMSLDQREAWNNVLLGVDRFYDVSLGAWVKTSPTAPQSSRP